MSGRKRILFYDNPQVPTGIGASLEPARRFEVVRLSQSLSDTNEVRALAPDVILLNTEMPGSAAALSAPENHPDLVLMGISPDAHIVRLWSGRRYRELSTKDVAALNEVCLTTEAGPVRPPSYHGPAAP